VALKCQKLVKFLRLNGSDGLRLRYFTPKFKKNTRATLTSGGVNLQHDNDWNCVYRWPACGGGSIWRCSVVRLMGVWCVRVAPACLSGDVDTVVEMLTTRFYKFIYRLGLL